MGKGKARGVEELKARGVKGMTSCTRRCYCHVIKDMWGYLYMYFLNKTHYYKWKMLHHTLLCLQKHCIRVVPVTEVEYEWKSKNYKFFVYGLDRLVYTADYPQTCCWGCNIL